ncbi:hypothetical protein DLAC_10210 [Tieghemostelium lacteum]|uniref:Transmembrane protein n=1 Tax=Tieghemostelium lacteum TaxID=361077 RepID=A0A151Z5B9_TIELA|nr:hypothetical protein DLAC_10210 [Tieghemostelium lacteum]|eukprot:KYQ88994.1 hypothetical protein DLAC_10210 [Tieghemostelium lacteum]
MSSRNDDYSPMTIFKYYILFIFLFFNLVQTIDIYISSSNGNDNNNGTLKYPYQTFDKVLEVLYNVTEINNNSEDVIVYFDQGNYTQSSTQTFKCTLACNISFQSINSNRSSTTIYGFQMTFSNRSQLTLTNMAIMSFQNNSQMDSGSSMLVINSIVNAGLGQSFTMNDSTLTLQDNSYINTGYVYISNNAEIHIINSTFSDSAIFTYYGSNHVHIKSSNLYNFQYSSYLSNNDTLIIENSQLNYTASTPFYIFQLNQDQQVSITNTQFSGIVTTQSLFQITYSKFHLSNCTITNSTLELYIINTFDSKVTLENIYLVTVASSSFINTQSSTIDINGMNIQQSLLIFISTQYQFHSISRGFTIPTTSSSSPLPASKITIDQLKLTYSQNNQFQFIMINTLYEPTFITISNSILDFISSSLMMNTEFLMSNTSINSISTSNLFQFDNGTSVEIQFCNFTTNSFISDSTLFQVYNSSELYLHDSKFFGCSSLMTIENHAKVNIKYCQFRGLYTKGKVFQAQTHSELQIKYSSFQESYCGQFITLYNSKFLLAYTSIMNATQWSNQTFGDFDYGSGVQFNNLQLVNIYSNGIGFSFSKQSTFEMIGCTFNYVTSTSIDMSKPPAQQLPVINCDNSHFTITNNNFSSTYYEVMFSTFQCDVTLDSNNIVSTSANFMFSQYGNITSTRTFITGLQGDYIFNKRIGNLISTNDIIKECRDTQMIFRVIGEEAVDFKATFYGLQIETIVNTGNSKIASTISALHFQDITVTFDECNIQSNTMDYNLLYFNNVEVYMSNSTVISNVIYNAEVISLARQSNMYMTKSEISYNTGSSTISVDDGSFIRIEESSIKFNSADNGGCLYILGSNGCYIDGSTFTNNTSNSNGGCIYFNSYRTIGCLQGLKETVFKYNSAPRGGGGAVYYVSTIASNDNTPLWSNYTTLFYENYALYGDQFAGGISYIKIQFTNTYVFQLKFTFSFRDFYNNVIVTENYQEITFQVNCTTDDQYSFSTVSFLEDGIGNVNVPLQQIAGLQYEIYIPSQSNYSIASYSSLCNNFSYETGNTCTYCPVGMSYSIDKSDCMECVPNLICMNSLVYTKPNYYLVENEITQVYECSPNLCLGNNECLGNYTTGDLCGQCTDLLGGFVPKSGMYCCNNYQENQIFISYFIILLLPIAFIWSLKFQFSSFYSTAGKVFTYLQSISIIFFSTSHLYIIPVFRFSIDIIYDYCPFQITNFIKSLIALGSILSLYIFLMLIKWIQINLKRMMSTMFRDHIHRKLYSFHMLYYHWSLFMLLYPPLVFNLISMVIYKKIYTTNTKYLSIDMEVSFNSDSTPSRLIILITFVSVTLFLLLPGISAWIIYQIKRQSPNSKSKFNKIIRCLPYRKGCKWWDIIHMVKSCIFSFLSISCLYNQELYSILLKSIQFVITIGEYAMQPYQQPQKNHINNLSNLLLLILILIIDYQTTLTNGIAIQIPGQTVTIYALGSILIFFLFEHIYKNKPQIPF